MELSLSNGARFTGFNILADEVVAEVSLDFEEKRDRYMFRS
jgi:hypothetical protein